MSHFSIDVGFDRDSEPKEPYDGYLQVEMVKSAPEDVVQVGDEIFFTLYDISEDESSTPPANFQVEFAKADEKTQHDSPLADRGAQLQLSSRGRQTSAIFGTYPSWYASGSQNPNNPATKLDLVNPGRYFYKVTVQIGNKTFGADPEMIVEPAG